MYSVTHTKKRRANNPITYVDPDGFAEIRFHLYANSAANYGPQQFQSFLTGGPVANTRSNRFEFMGHNATFHTNKRSGMADISKSLNVPNAAVIFYGHSAFEKGTGRLLGLLDTNTPGKVGISTDKLGGMLKASKAAVVFLAACSSSQFAEGTDGPSTVVGLLSPNKTTNENAVSQALSAFVDTLVGVDSNGNLVGSGPGTIQDAVNAANKVLEQYKMEDRFKVIQGDPNRRLE